MRCNRKLCTTTTRALHSISCLMNLYRNKNTGTRNCMIFSSELDKNHLYKFITFIFEYIELCRTDLFYLFVLQTKSRMLKQSTWWIEESRNTNQVLGRLSNACMFRKFQIKITSLHSCVYTWNFVIYIAIV